MLSIHVRVELVEPPDGSSGEGRSWPIVDGIEVQLARLESSDPAQASEIIHLQKDPGRGLFVLEARGYTAGPQHRFRVRFLLPNFSMVTRRLHAASEITQAMHPVFCPSRLPVWDASWAENVASNPLFDQTGLRRPSTPAVPFLLRIPLRRLFVIGHRGAPYRFPENTLASFQAALELGANGLEFDLCITRDRQIVLFHDPRPDRLRILFERFPYELVSPEIAGRRALLKELRDGRYVVVRRRLIGRASLDIRNRTLSQVRRWFKYQHVNGVEYGIPRLEEFLEWASSRTDTLQLLFFDVKDPGWRFAPRRRLRRYGRLLGSVLRRYSHLPTYLVIAHPRPQGLATLRKGIRSAGEDRCLFAVDTGGSLGAMFGFKEDPLATARRMGTEVVSIGARFRTGDQEEIFEASRDRDDNRASPVSMVLHWTLNDPELMRQSLERGINGIISDRPELLRTTLGELGLVASQSGDRRTHRV